MLTHKAGDIRLEHVVVDLNPILELIQLVEEVAVLLFAMPLINGVENVLIVMSVCLADAAEGALFDLEQLVLLLAGALGLLVVLLVCCLVEKTPHLLSRFVH